MSAAVAIAHVRPMRGVVIVAALRERLWERGLRVFFGGSTQRATKMDALEDKALVAHVLGGGAQGDLAYEVLIRRHQSWVLRLIQRLLSSFDSDAEDVTQEVFVGAFLALDSWRQEAPFRGWLRTIAMRTAFNWQRGRRTARRYEDRARSDQEVLGAQNIRHGGDGRLALEELDGLLQQMSYPYREVLLLRHMEEMSIDEIAKTLEISASATKMRLKRARAQLKELYDDATR